MIRALLIAAAIYYGLLELAAEPSPYRVWSEGDLFYRLDIETGDVCMTALETGLWVCSDDFRALALVCNGKRKVHRSRLRQDKGHRAEWQTFGNVIIKGGQPPIPYTELLGVTRATFAAVEALRSGRKEKINY